MPKKAGPGGGSSNMAAPPWRRPPRGGPTTAAAPERPELTARVAWRPAGRGNGAADPAVRRGARAEREPGGPIERTVYTLGNGQPQPVKVKLGITDSIYTEVLEGPERGRRGDHRHDVAG
jgi:hypothetical protein